MISLAGYAKYLELLYTDRMDITRTEEITVGNTVNNEFPGEPQDIDIRCRFSSTGRDRRGRDPDDFSQIEFIPRIFCNPKVSLPAGCRLNIRRCHANGEVYATLDAVVADSGFPMIYETHQEVDITITGDP